MKYIIREIHTSEYSLLNNFLYEAIFQKDENNLLPRSIINQPELKVYIEGFGKPDDYCLVAEIDGEIVGAVWSRVLSGEVKGFGSINDNIPELAISLYKEFRNNGIGTALMEEIIGLLKDRGYKNTSLAVQKDNYAVKMYKDLGFKVVEETEEEFIMIYKLD